MTLTIDYCLEQAQGALEAQTPDSAEIAREWRLLADFLWNKEAVANGTPRGQSPLPRAAGTPGGKEAAWFAFQTQHPDVDWDALEKMTGNDFVQDVLGKGRQYGKLSDKQLAALKKTQAPRTRRSYDDEAPF